MLNIILDGWSVLIFYKAGIAVFIVAAFGFGHFFMKQIVDEEMENGINLFANFSIGSVVLCIISYALVWVAHFLPFLLYPASLAVLIFGIFFTVKGIWLDKSKMIVQPFIIVAGVALFLLLVARLAFLKYIILPSYSDSPIHYQIVYGLLHPNTGEMANLSLGNILNQYYHFGFHGIAAWLASITAIAPADAISLIGQLFVVITPISVIVLAYFLMRDIGGALFAGLLAAIGWFMPAFAVNWGKFPALSALATLPIVLAFLGYFFRGDPKRISSLTFGLLLLAGITLLHTRILICVALAVTSLFLSSKLQTTNEISLFQSLRFSVLFLVSLWPIHQLIMDFYSGILTAIIWLILLPFAFQAFPKISVGVFFYILGSWLIALGPTLTKVNVPTFLDRQFLEIMLYFPFSIMGGAGFAGLIRKIPFKDPKRWLTILALIGCVAFSGLQSNAFRPDPCCLYFKNSDQLAMQWIQQNTSVDTLFLISAFNENDKITGTDAGIWIYPLLGKNTNKLGFDTNWNSKGELDKICRFTTKKIYVYMGGQKYSFNNTQLGSTEWFKSVFNYGQTIIYEITGCP